MALFMDGPLSGIEDLAAEDSQVLNVANVEGIDLTQKLLKTQEELALELETLLEGPRRAEPRLWQPPHATIRNVVATPPLKLWHTFRTLELVYAEAYSNQLNARYAAKQGQFGERAKWAYSKLMVVGIGIVWSPVPRSTGAEAISAQGNLPDGTYYLATAWSNSKAEEGASSTPCTLTIAGSTFLVQPGTAPQGVTGWNVYAGVDPAAMHLQNGLPIGVTQTWLQPNSITTTGRAPGNGQSANYMMPLPKMILRG